MVVKQIEINSMDIELLHRTREILRLFQLSDSDNLSEILAELGAILGVSLLVVDCEGKFMASSAYFQCVSCLEEKNTIKLSCFSDDSYRLVEECLFNNCSCRTLKYVKSIPFYREKNLLAHLLIINFGEPLAQEDILLAEIAAIFLNNIFVITLTKKENESEQAKLKLQFALNNLSYSGEKIFFDILQNFEISQPSQHINITALAAQKGISAPVITRTLKLLQSAGVIQHRSLGSRGSIICITNSYLLQNLSSVLQKLA